MFTNEQLDNLLTMYKDNVKECEKATGTDINSGLTVSKGSYSTVMRGRELLSVRKDLLKVGDSLVISDEETLECMHVVSRVLKEKGLVKFRKEFPKNFRNGLTSSRVYTSGLGKRFAIESFSKSLESLRKSVSRLEAYRGFDLKLSDEYIKENHGGRLKGLGFLVENNRLVSIKYREDIHYILKTYPNDNTYKKFIKDDLLFKLLIGYQDGKKVDEARILGTLVKKGEYQKLNSIKAELNRGLTKVKEFESILESMLRETRRLNIEYKTVVDPYKED